MGSDPTITWIMAFPAELVEGALQHHQLIITKPKAVHKLEMTMLLESFKLLRHLQKSGILED